MFLTRDHAVYYKVNCFNSKRTVEVEKYFFSSEVQKLIIRLIKIWQMIVTEMQLYEQIYIAVAIVHEKKLF